MDLTTVDSKKKVELNDSVFSCEFNGPLVHQIVTAYMAARRAGTKAQKTRAEVSGGGIKPWRQKGTGRARAGTIRSPLWRTGGKTFAAKPRNFEQKVNKKMYRGALRSIFSELVRQERLHVVGSFQLEQPKTKLLVAKLADFECEGKTLIVSGSIESPLYLASRNLPRVDVKDAVAALADPVALVGAETVIVTEDAIKEIERSLS